MAKGTRGFDTTGKVHHKGKKNESITQKILIFKKLASNMIKLIGGTKNKEDLFDPILNIFWSIKHKTSITSGSFDWIHTTKVYNVVGDTFVPFLEKIKGYRKNLTVSERSVPSFVKEVRKEFANLCSGVLDSFTAEQLTSFIQQNLIDANTKIKVGVNHSTNKNLYIFDANQHPAVQYIKEGYTPFLQGDAKGSRRLLFTDGKNEYDCGLRIRVTSNNGVTAFLGLSTSNKNAYVVFKLQQEKIKKLIQQVNAEVIDYSDMDNEMVSL